MTGSTIFALACAAATAQAPEASTVALAQADASDAQMLELFQAGRYREAEDFARQSLELRQQALGRVHGTVASSLNNLAMVLQEQGRFAEALPLHEESLRVTRETKGERHGDVAMGLNNMALLHEAMGAFDSALPLYEESLEIRREFDGPRHVKVGLILGNLAVLLGTMGNHAGALPLLHESLEIRRDALGPRHPDVAVTLTNLGMTMRELGDYSAAQTLIEESLDILAETVRDGHPFVAQSKSRLASVLQELGDLDGAGRLLEESLAIQEAVYGPRNHHVGAALANLARLRQAKGEFPAAEALFERALDIQDETLGHDHNLTSITRNNLATLLQDMGHLDRAQVLYEQALEGYRRTLGDRHPSAAANLNNLAGLHQIRGDYPLAQQLYEESLEINLKAFGPRHPRVAIGLSSLAASLELAGKHGEAEPHRIEALDIVEERLFLLDTLPERVALDFLDKARFVLDPWIAAFDDPEHAADAWTHTLRFKGAVAQRLSNARVLASVDDEAAHIAQDLQKARAEIAQIAFLEPNMEEAEARHERTAELIQRREGLERDLLDRSATFRAARDAREADPMALCAALRPGEAIVDIVRYQRLQGAHYAAFTLRSGDCTVTRVELGPADPIDDAVAGWREVLDDPAAVQVRVDARGLLLSQQIWTPLQPLVGDASHVYLVPDGALSGAPLDALPLDNGRYLLEKLSISYLDRAHILLEAPSPVGRGAVVVGGVDYDAANAQTSRGTRSRLAACNGGGFAPLPGAAEEATLLTKRWSRARRRDPLSSLTGAGASESAVAAELEGKELVHLATHGFFAVGECRSMIEGAGVAFDPMLLSGLALAGANRPPDPLAGEDGILTAAELASLDLTGTRLVVLSACETGLGEIRSGEGVLGLRRAFSVAGAEVLISTLWSISDDATASLMDDVYRRFLHPRRPATAAEALRRAKLAQLAGQRAKGNVRPQEWAGFVASGR